MPAKIITEASLPLKGKINKDDLAKITQDFKDSVQLQRSNGLPIVKVDSLSIPLSIVKHLIENITMDELKTSSIKVKFGVTLPNQKDCMDPEKDVANHLTTIIVVEKDGVEQTNEHDFVIVAGFKEFISELQDDNTDALCCPVIRP